MSISQQSKEALARIFNDPATREVIAEVKASFVKKATSLHETPEARQENLVMLWGIDALLNKVNANKVQSDKDQAK